MSSSKKVESIAKKNEESFEQILQGEDLIQLNQFSCLD